MLLDLSTWFKRLRATLWRQPRCPPVLPLPPWVANDPLVQHYRALIGCLPWAELPLR